MQDAAADLGDAYRAAAHDRAPRADGRRRADPHACRPTRRARQCRAAAWAGGRRGAARAGWAARRARGRNLRRHFARGARAAVERPRHPAPGARRARFRRRPRRRRGMSATGARARRARCARRRRRQAFEAMLPGLLQAIAAGPDPERALNRLSDIVERLSSGVNLFRLLEARPAARASCWRRSSPTRRRSPTSSPPAGAARGAVRRVELRPRRPRPTISPPTLGEAMARHPYDIALDRVRRLVNERRFALGVQLIDRPPRSARGRGRLCAGRGRARRWRSAAPRRGSSRTAMAAFPAASW